MIKRYRLSMVTAWKATRAQSQDVGACVCGAEYAVETVYCEFVQYRRDDVGRNVDTISDGETLEWLCPFCFAAGKQTR